MPVAPLVDAGGDDDTLDGVNTQAFSIITDFDGEKYDCYNNNFLVVRAHTIIIIGLTLVVTWEALKLSTWWKRKLLGCVLRCHIHSHLHSCHVRGDGGVCSHKRIMVIIIFVIIIWMDELPCYIYAVSSSLPYFSLRASIQLNQQGKWETTEALKRSFEREKRNCAWLSSARCSGETSN